MYKSLSYYVTILRRDFTAYCNRKLHELGLSQGLLFFILYVGKNPGCSHGELAEALHMDTGHVTRSLAKLETSGFIRQETRPDDRRARSLYLRDRGLEAFETSRELFNGWDREMMGDMPEPDREQLLKLLKGLTDKTADIHGFYNRRDE